MQIQNFALVGLSATVLTANLYQHRSTPPSPLPSLFSHPRLHLRPPPQLKPPPIHHQGTKGWPPIQFNIAQYAKYRRLPSKRAQIRKLTVTILPGGLFFDKLCMYPFLVKVNLMFMTTTRS